MEERYCYGCMEQTASDMDQCPKCGFLLSEYLTEPHQLMPGTVLRERYAVGRVLGEGGFGITYVGRDQVLDLKVAIKEFYMSGYVNRNNTCSTIVQANTGTHGETFAKNRERFLTEARVLAKFAGEEGIVGIRDFFQENNTAYIVMDFLSGETLRSYIDRSGKVSGDRMVQILNPVLRSLGHVHDHDVIHRDISPDNIMLTDDGKVKLLDFGAARQVSKNDIKSLSIILKPGYAPEEQYRSKGKQGPWTDIYALCATMYRCITGITPDDAMERMFDDKLVHPAQLDCDCSLALGNVIVKGLAVRMNDRYRSIAELTADLERAAAAPDDGTIAAPQQTESDDQVTVYVGGSQTVMPVSDGPTVPVDSDSTVYAGRIDGPMISADPDSTVYAGRIDGPTVPAEEVKKEQPEKKEKPEKKAKPEKQKKPVKEKPEKKKKTDVQPEAEGEAPEAKGGKKKGGLKVFLAILVVAIAAAVVMTGLGKEKKGSGKMPEAFAGYELTLNGQTVSVPTTFDRMEELGWTYQNQDALDETLAPGQTSSYFELSNGYGELTVYFQNHTNNTLAIRDCLIFKIVAYDSSFDSSYTGQTVNILSTPGGYSFGETTEKDFTKTAPKGYFMEKRSGYTYFWYESAEDGIEDRYEIAFYDGSLDKITITNQDYSDFDTDSYMTEAPDYDEEALRAYIGAELKIIAGDYEYPVPLTLQDYINMGYIVERADAEYLPSGHTTTVYLRADTFNTLKVEVLNPFRSALAINECFVAIVDADNIDSDGALAFDGILDGKHIRVNVEESLDAVKGRLNAADIGWAEGHYSIDIYHRATASGMLRIKHYNVGKVTDVEINLTDVLKDYFQNLGL